MLTSLQIEELAKEEGDVIVRFSGDELNTRSFCISGLKGRVLLEYVARTCVEDWMDQQGHENWDEPELAASQQGY
jgi:hypothetical protein